MIKAGTLFWAATVIVLGLAMFGIKYGVQGLEGRLIQVQKQTVAEQEEIRVLHAEWTYLTQPRRLAALNQRFLSLAPIAAKQIVASVADLPFRPAPAPAPVATVLASASAAAAAAMPVLRPAVATPARPLVAEPTKATLRPPRSLDDLFAAVASGPR